MNKPKLSEAELRMREDALGAVRKAREGQSPRADALRTTIARCDELVDELAKEAGPDVDTVRELAKALRRQLVWMLDIEEARRVAAP